MDAATLKRHIDTARALLTSDVQKADAALRRADAANSKDYRVSLVTAQRTKAIFDQICHDGTALRAMLASSSDGFRYDSQTLVYAARQLEYVFTEIEREEFKDLPMAEGKIIPIDRSVPEGAKTFVWYLFSSSGVARFIAPVSAGSLPRVSLAQAERVGRVQTMGAEFGYSSQELRHAQYAGVGLDSELARACRRAHDELLNRTGFWGREDLGLPGFFNHPNIQVSDAADNGSGATEWAEKEPIQIIADIANVINGVRSITYGQEQVNRVAIANAEFDLISSTFMGDDLRRTILSALVEIFGQERMGRPAVEFFPLFELEAANSDGNLESNAMFAYTFDARKASLVQPMAYKQHEVQQQGLNYVVPTESSTGGVKMSRPLMCHRQEAIG